MGRAARTGGAEDPAGVFAGSGALYFESVVNPELSHPQNGRFGGGNVHTDVRCPPNDGFGGWLLEIDRFGSKAAAPLAKRPASV